eukprot:1485521-Pyramimonas_sp.AAC.1
MEDEVALFAGATFLSASTPAAFLPSGGGGLLSPNRAGRLGPTAVQKGFGCVTVIPMGWLSAVGVAQRVMTYRSLPMAWRGAPSWMRAR